MEKETIKPTVRKAGTTSQAPLVLSSDKSRSLSARFASLFAQARARELEKPGADYSDTLLRHLVEAQLRQTVPSEKLRSLKCESAGWPKIDDSLEEATDGLVLNHFIFHCAARASRFASVIRTCRTEAANGFSPIVITPAFSLRTLLGLAAEAGIMHQLEIWGFEQWLAGSLYVHPSGTETRSEALKSLVRACNALAAEDGGTDALPIVMSN